MKVNKKVKDVMKSSFELVDGMLSVSEAITIMRKANTKTLIIDKRDEHDEYGIVLTADIAKKVLARSRSPKRVNVYEIMSKPMITVSPDLNIRYCAKLFERFHLSRAPVIEHEKIIGMVSLTDMVLRGLCTEE
jgi:predicted transcriptional regulator